MSEDQARGSAVPAAAAMSPSPSYTSKPKEEPPPSYLCLCTSPLQFDFAPYRIWFDEAHQQLVLFRDGIYFTLKLTRSHSPFVMDGGFPLMDPVATQSAPISFVADGDVYDVKFSMNERLLAVQRSSSVVEIVDKER